MVSTLTPYTTDEEICSQLRMFFSVEEMWSIDFMNLLSQAVPRGDSFVLDIMGRRFKIMKVTGSVVEVKV